VRVLMLFLDGVGIGKHDESVNPFFVARLPTLRGMLGGQLPSLRRRVLAGPHATLTNLDATLGVDGLPQSGTGQTALFTGVNAAKIVGKHFGPYPYSSLRPIIEGRNIFRRLKEAGKNPCFANAFPQRFFDYMNHRKTRMTVTTLSCTMAGVPLLRADDLRAGRGVSADITNHGWVQLGYPEILPIEPFEAGRRLVELSAEFDFVLFEYWKTDHAGHSQSMREAVESLERLDALLAGVLGTIENQEMIVFMTSDHGNIEDLSTKGHTRHPVPALVYGKSHERIARRLHSGAGAPGSLMDVTPTLLELITNDHPHRGAMKL
jgi:2,3-bisphosphoglycerate-independent phosphoglycerate mutase